MRWWARVDWIICIKIGGVKVISPLEEDNVLRDISR